MFEQRAEGGERANLVEEQSMWREGQGVFCEVGACLGCGLEKGVRGSLLSRNKSTASTVHFFLNEESCQEEHWREKTCEPGVS